MACQVEYAYKRIWFIEASNSRLLKYFSGIVKKKDKVV